MERYEIKTDTNLVMMEDGHGEYLLKGVDEILHVGDRTDRDLLDASGEDWAPTILSAAPEEVQEWTEKFQHFSEMVQLADKTIGKAASEFRELVNQVREGVQKEYAAYLPVQEEIERRRDRVEELREQADEERDRAAQEAADALLAAEDAEYGPRLFLVTRPSQRGQNKSDMDAPTIHHVDCGVAARLSRKPDPVRIGDAFEALMEGGLLATKRFYTWEPDKEKGIRLPGVACERCQAFELLKAHAPETFMDWLERTESSQRGSLPPATYTGEKRLFEKLGLPQWTSYPFTPGWVRAARAEAYREHNQVGDDEALIGWVEQNADGKPTIVSNVDRLKKLFGVLPPRGYEVRWLHNPPQYDPEEGVCDIYVAVRPMSKWAIRRRVKKG